MPSKNLERLYLERFLEFERQFSIVNNRDDQEAPDFILRDSSGLIGLEITQLFRDSGPGGSPTKATEFQRQRFLSDVADQYYPAGAPILVQAALPERPTDDPHTVARALRDNRPAQPWDRTSVAFPGDSKYVITALPPEVGLYRRWQCLNNSIGWVGRLEKKMVIDRIQEKARKLVEYRKAVNRIALLLVIDRRVKSGMVEPPDLTGISSEGFDEIYLQMFPAKAVRVAP